MSTFVGNTFTRVDEVRGKYSEIEYYDTTHEDDESFAYDMYDVVEAIRWLYNAVENGFGNGYKPELIEKIRKLEIDT